MMKSRFSLAGVLSVAAAAIASVGSSAARAAETVAGFVWTIVAAFVRAVAYPQTWFPLASTGPNLVGFARSSAPFDVDVRHEAAVHRRSAARHI